jgi:hypothetical protein
MPYARSALAAALAALALAPAAAHAQGAGDDQYADPFGGQDAPQATPAPRRTPAPTPAPPQSAAPASTPAPAGPSRAQPTPPPTLPYTGVDAWPLALSGALLLGSGLALRARLRASEPD